MRSFYTSALLLLLTAPAMAEVRFVARPAPPGTPGPIRALSAEAKANKLAEPTNELFVPYYAVNANSGSGTTTLFAVRNILFETITLRIDYFPITGGTVTETTLLESRETFTRNIRDVLALPITGGGFKEGWLIISARDPVSGDLLLDTYLHGDHFFVTPGENFATGSALESTGDFCELWDTRYAVGGAFDDTEIRLTMPFNTPGPETLVATVAVYDEDGFFYGDIDIFATGEVEFFFASELLDLLGDGANFGVFEWTFVGGLGFISQEIKAEGRYAAGWSPACLDAAFF